MQSRVYATVGRPSVCLFVCPIRSLHAAAAGLLLWALRPGDIDLLLHGGQQQMRAVPRCRLMWEAGHRLVHCTGGTELTYHKFDASSSSVPHTSSDSAEPSCALVMATGQWRISRCTDSHATVCQSDHLLPGIDAPHLRYE